MFILLKYYIHISSFASKSEGETQLNNNHIINPYTVLEFSVSFFENISYTYLRTGLRVKRK